MEGTLREPEPVRIGPGVGRIPREAAGTGTAAEVEGWEPVEELADSGGSAEVGEFRESAEEPAGTGSVAGILPSVVDIERLGAAARHRLGPPCVAPTCRI